MSINQTCWKGVSWASKAGFVEFILISVVSKQRYSRASVLLCPRRKTMNL